jgi:hypothetical protein
VTWAAHMRERSSTSPLDRHPNATRRQPIRCATVGTSVSERSDATVSLGWRVALLVFAVVAVVHAFSPSVQIGDSRLSVPVATQVLRHHTLDLSSDPLVTALTNKYDVREVHGQLLPFYPWLPMLFAVPGVIAADAVGKDPATLRPSKPNQTWKIELPTASLLVAFTATVLAFLTFGAASGRPRFRRRLALAVGFTYAFATGAWSTGSRALWQQTPSMLFLALALLAAWRLERLRSGSVVLGMTLAAGYIMRPPDAVVVACFVVWVATSHRRELARVVIGLGIVLVPFVAMNLRIYHALLPPYFSGSCLGTEASVGWLNTAGMFLVSPSRGLLIYDPIVVAAIAGLWLQYRRRALTSLDFTLCAAIVGQWIVVATYGSTGGESYGPRLMIDVLPFIVYLATPAFAAVFSEGIRESLASSRRAVAVVMLLIIGWGVLVNASGALLRSSYCWNASPALVDNHPSRVWDWRDPQFFRPVKDLLHGASPHDIMLQSCSPT